MVRAKFRVTKIEKVAAWSGNVHETDNVELSAVTDDANKTWSKWTPGGQMRMTINNPEALNQFKIGQAYFLDFTEAPPTEAEESPNNAKAG